MKKYLFLLFSSVLLMISCKTTSYQTTNTVFLTGNSNSISMRSVGTGERANETQDNAELRAVKVLLFRGLPDSQQKDPLISVSETEAIAMHKEYFESFFNQKRYKTFIVSTVSVSDVQMLAKKNYQQTFDITINLKALRSDLERQGIIRKFGL